MGESRWSTISFRNLTPKEYYMNDTAHNMSALYMAIECSSKEWKLAFGDGKADRQVTIRAGHVAGLQQQILRAKARWGLSEETPVYSCYEAGRDGLWIHRMLTDLGLTNVVVDPASIEVPQRRRRAKTDRLDASKLLAMLLRYWIYGERKTWRVLHVPSTTQEDARRPHRERERLVKERTGHRARIRSLLVLQGAGMSRLPTSGAQARDWQGRPLPSALCTEVDRELMRLRLVEDQLREVSKGYRHASESACVRHAHQLARFSGVGFQTGWLLAHEFFWRSFHNRREVGAAAGLVGCPYDSGTRHVEQGISKSGSARVRVAMTELAWRWLWFQPHSELSLWFQRRFGTGSARMRRIGIVALARKLLVALWKYLEHEEVPAGAKMSA